MFLFRLSVFKRLYTFEKNVANDGNLDNNQDGGDCLSGWINQLTPSCSDLNRWLKYLQSIVALTEIELIKKKKIKKKLNLKKKKGQKSVWSDCIGNGTI